MSSYYPDGVTGNEPEIAGYPEWEKDVGELECIRCGEGPFTLPLLLQRDYGEWASDWVCPHCNSTNTYYEAED